MRQAHRAHRSRRLGKRHRIAAWDNADARGVDWDKLAADTTDHRRNRGTLVAGDRSPRGSPPLRRLSVSVARLAARARRTRAPRTRPRLIAKPRRSRTRRGYLDVLSLIAHEFFHLWNVKRIRPGGLSLTATRQENYTRLSGGSKGRPAITIGACSRSPSCATPAEYLSHLAEEIARLEDTPGARVHSLEESSFDAWIKAYRPDENSLNSTVSYYLKGEDRVRALRLSRSAAVPRPRRPSTTWSGTSIGASARKELPLPEDALPAIFAEVAGASLDDCFERWVQRNRAASGQRGARNVGLEFERSERATAPRRRSASALAAIAGRAIVDATYRGARPRTRASTCTTRSSPSPIGG